MKLPKGMAVTKQEFLEAVRIGVHDAMRAEDRVLTVTALLPCVTCYHGAKAIEEVVLARRAAAEGRRSTIALFAPDVLPTGQARRGRNGRHRRDGRQNFRVTPLGRPVLGWRHEGEVSPDPTLGDYPGVIPKRAFRAGDIAIERFGKNDPLAMLHIIKCLEPKAVRNSIENAIIDKDLANGDLRTMFEKALRERKH